MGHILKNPNYTKIGKSNCKAKCPNCGSKQTDFYLSRSSFSTHRFQCGKCGFILEW